MLALILLAGCEQRRPPPPAFRYEGLPVQGSWPDARDAGLTYCTRITRHLRCRREGVMLKGQGPFSAAADLLYSDGSGGFYELTLWHNGDQRTTSAFGDMLEKQGWEICRTGPNENRGDQAIYTKAGAPVRFSIDLSYWGKRRLRILPELNQPKGHCW
jgi:hypothetical protein